MAVTALGFLIAALGTSLSGSGARLSFVHRGVAHTIPMLVHDGSAYVPLTEFGQSVGATIKDISPTQIGVCPTDDLCIFVEKDDGDIHRLPSGALAIRLAAVPDAFRVAFAQRGDTLVLNPSRASDLRIAPGDLLPDVILPNLDGTPYSFASARGRKMVLFTWASW